MTTEKQKELIALYKSTATLIVEVFCEKQEMGFEHWVDEGHIALCSDFFFNFSDILQDLEKEVEKGKIIEWYDYSMEEHQSGRGYVNYNSWLMGYRNEPTSTEKE